VGRQQLTEYVEHLKEQIGFLLKSAGDFDEGDISESKRMATAIRTLVHETSTSHAYCEQLRRLLASPEVSALVADLEATRWSGRPGYPIPTMLASRWSRASSAPDLD
jgi:hypothetical protein